jgi:hypothetical protein
MKFLHLAAGAAALPAGSRIAWAQHLISRPAIVSLRPIPHIIDTGKQRLARELPNKRRRTEFSVPYSGSAGAVGRHINYNKAMFGAVPSSTHVRPRAPSSARGASFSELHTWTFGKVVQSRNGSARALDQLRTPLSAFDWRREPALRHINRFSSKWPTGGLRSLSAPRRRTIIAKRVQAKRRQRWSSIDSDFLVGVECVMEGARCGSRCSPSASPLQSA